MKKEWIENFQAEKAGVKLFQEGGQAPPAPDQGGGGDPAAQLEQMLMQYAETKDPQLAVAIADMLVEAMMQAQGGAQGGAPAGPPEGGAPMAKDGMRVPGGPVFKKDK